MHGIGRHRLGHLHHHRVGVIPNHPDGFQQRELLFQFRFLGGGVKAENVLFGLHTQCLQDLAAGIAAHLLHHGAVRRLHLNGADLKQHGHGQVNTGGDHGQQGHKGHQPPQHPPPFQRGAGQAALLAFFPLYRVAWLLLCRAQTLVFVALLRCLSRCLARLLPL